MQLKPKLSDEILIKISPNSPGLNPNITGLLQPYPRMLVNSVFYLNHFISFLIQRILS